MYGLINVDKTKQYRCTLNIVTSNSETIIIEDGNIQNISYKSSSTDTSDIKLGFASSATFDFSIFNLNGEYEKFIYKGGMVIPTIYPIDVETNEEITVDLGVFKIERTQSRDGILSFETIDRMVDFDVEWGGGTFPMTAQHLLEVLCRQVNIKAESYEFLNSDFEISMTGGSKFKDLSCRQILVFLCELSGNFSFINKSGNLELKWYDFTKICDNLKYNYMTDFDREENTVNITGISLEINDELYSFGNDWYELALTQNNPIFDGATKSALNDAIEQVWLKKLKPMSYLPCKFKTAYNPMLDLGDVLKVEDEKGNEYLSFLNIIETDLDISSYSCNGKSRNEEHRYSGGSFGGGNDSKNDIKFVVDRNVSEYVKETQPIMLCSASVGIKKDTKLFIGISIAYELGSATKVKIELLINDTVEMSWQQPVTSLFSNFGVSYIPKAIKTGYSFVSVRITPTKYGTNGGNYVSIMANHAVLSILVKGGEGQEVPRYPEINVTENFSRINILEENHVSLASLNEKLNVNEVGETSNVINEKFNLINMKEYTIKICEDIPFDGNDYEKLSLYTNGQLSKYTHEQLKKNVIL